MIWRSELPVTFRRLPLHQFVFEQADRAGERAVALKAAEGDDQLTYGQLSRSVEQLAAGLHGVGVRQYDVIAIMAPNTPHYATAILAASRLGAVISTINPVYLPAEVGKQLADSRAKVVLTVSELIDAATQAVAEAGTGATVVSIDAADNTLQLLELMATDHTAPRVTIDADDVVCLPYSSGTTGLPKGVMLTHYSMVSNLLQLEAIGPEMQPGDQVIGLLPLFHSYGLTVLMLGGLRGGATLVTVRQFELKSFLETLQDQRINWAHLVPPLILALAKHPMVDDYDLSGLQYVFSGAAPLDEGLAGLFEQRFGLVVRQGYGMTEASPVTHYPPARSLDVRPGTVGKVTPGAECKIIDLDTKQALGPGQRGELWVRGPQLMKGYWKNPEASALTIDRNGWLHTGDIAVMDEDGYLSVVDRVKELIKFKGFQIAPAELEGVLITHPQITDAAVIPMADERAGEVPLAFVVRSDAAVDEQAVKDFVAERVAPYKQLREVRFIESIPKTASGKILRRVLARA
ncbi:MAG: AMP-dependent synthetase [Lysobacteraceae bacterium]|nr:MAG: AMP-dependent synthetase [Xanthomonadaceae bacterium]